MKNEKIIKQIKRLIYASDAFQEAEDLLGYIQDQNLKVGDSLFNPMMAGVITTYGMNFNKANGLGPLPAIYENFEDEKIKDAHKKIIKARNQLYAHRDIQSTKDHIEHAYKINVWLENGKLQFRPIMIDISHNRITEIQALISFQRNRLQEDLDKKLIQVIDTTKSYNQNELWELGYDFP
jgi:hypothetical protein